MQKKNIALIIAIVILVGVTAAGTYVSIQNYKKAESQRIEQTTGDEKKDGEGTAKEEKKDSQQAENKDAAANKAADKAADNAADGAQPGDDSTGDKSVDDAIANKTPVFMYFVSESDSDYDAALKVFDELKKEYDGKIEFQLHDITKDKEILERFSIVDGNTPALIMDGKDLGLQFKTTDKNVLAGEIEKSLK